VIPYKLLCLCNEQNPRKNLRKRNNFILRQFLFHRGLPLCIKKKWHYYNKKYCFHKDKLTNYYIFAMDKTLEKFRENTVFFTHMLFLQGLTPYKSHIGKSNNLKVWILHTLTISHMSVKKLSTSARFDSLQMHAGILTLCHTIWPQKWILCKYNIIIKCHNYQHLNKNLRSHLHSM
jgi:hypothetical protein